MLAPPNPMAQLSQDSRGRRLDSWKEIAAFFGRDERTVRRWAADRSLPVHRIPGASKGRVFAYDSELQQWLSASTEQSQSSQPREDQPQDARNETGPVDTSHVKKWLIGLAASAAVAVLLVFNVTRYFSVHAWPMNLTTEAKHTAPKPGTAQAQELYLQGRYYWNRRTPDDLNRAVDYFTQATLRDPNYSNAYVGLADSYSLLREYGSMPSEVAYPRALAAAKKAVELDDSSSDAHSSLAFVTFYWNWDAVGAEREFKRALALNPNDARAHHWYATFLLTCRRVPESLAQIDEAQKLDPTSVAILADKGDILNIANQTDAAMALLRQIEITEPSFLSAHRYLSEIYLARKDYPDYLKEWEQMTILLKDQNGLAVERAAKDGFSKGGYQGMLRGTLRAQKELNNKGIVPAYSLAVTYARLGEKQNSLQCLRDAYDKHDSALLFLAIEPAFDSLTHDPEFTDLEARVSPVLNQGTPHS